MASVRCPELFESTHEPVGIDQMGVVAEPVPDLDGGGRDEPGEPRRVRRARDRSRGSRGTGIGRLARSSPSARRVPRVSSRAPATRCRARRPGRAVAGLARRSRSDVLDHVAGHPVEHRVHHAVGTTAGSRSAGAAACNPSWKSSSLSGWSTFTTERIGSSARRDGRHDDASERVADEPHRLDALGSDGGHDVAGQVDDVVGVGSVRIARGREGRRRRRACVADRRSTIGDHVSPDSLRPWTSTTGSPSPVTS